MDSKLFNVYPHLGNRSQENTQVEKTLEWRDSYGIQHGSASRGVASPTSASRNDRRQGEGDTREIGPYHGDSSCTTRSEGFSRRLPRGWRRGLKRFRWETQQGVNGSRRTRWRCPERFVRGEKKKSARRRGRRKHVCVHVRTYTIKRSVSLCVNGDTCARARNSEFATAYHCSSTTITRVSGVFVRESWVYLVPRRRWSHRRPFFPFIFAKSRDISCENTRQY